MADQKGRLLHTYTPDYVVFDLETTGISPKTDQVIEISAVKVQSGTTVDEFSTLVNPGRPIPYGASQVNGITDEMVKDAPEMEEAVRGFLNFVENDILVGHNIHTFDMKFLWNKTETLFGETVANDYIDTLSMARQRLPQLSHHKLVDISSYYKISTEGAHRALNDCIMNQKCFELLAKEQVKNPPKICPRCGGELTKRRGRFGTFLGCSGYPACRYTENC